MTGVLHCKGPSRMRTVRSIFREQEGLTVCWTPIHSGSGNSATSHASFKDFLGNSTKDRLTPANPNLLLCVDVAGTSDEEQPNERGPRGPRKQKEPLHTDMESIMALPGIPGAQTKRRAYNWRYWAFEQLLGRKPQTKNESGLITCFHKFHVTQFQVSLKRCRHPQQ